MSQRLPQIVAGKIRDMIIEKGMHEGDKLPTENELINRYNVSRSSVREAVKILEAENIVEIRHGYGSFVACQTGMTKDPLGLCFTDQSSLLGQLLEVRLLMEPDISAMAATRRTEDDIASMERSLREMELAAEEKRDYHSFDYKFHIAIAQCIQNSVLERIFPVIFEAIEAGYAKTTGITGSSSRAIGYHHKILDAIKRADSEDAKKYTRMHIMQTYQDIMQQQEGDSK